MKTNTERLCTAAAVSVLCLLGTTACEGTGGRADKTINSPTIVPTPMHSQDLLIQEAGGREIHFTVDAQRIGKLVFVWGEISKDKISSYESITCNEDGTMSAIASTTQQEGKAALLLKDNQSEDFLYYPVSDFCENGGFRQFGDTDVRNLATTLNNFAATKLPKPILATGLPA